MRHPQHQHDGHETENKPARHDRNGSGGTTDTRGQRTLTDKQWRLPSAASGWPLQEVVTHAGCLIGFLMDQVGGTAEMPDIEIQKLNEIKARRNGAGTAARIPRFCAHTSKSPRSVRVVVRRAPGIYEGSVGGHPLHAIADMFTFDLTPR